MSVDFPSDFPLEDARLLADAARNPSAHSFAEVALAGWRVEGFGLGVAVQLRTQKQPVQSSRACGSKEELAALLDEAARCCGDDKGRHEAQKGEASASVAGFNWQALALAVIQFLPQILAALGK